MSKKLLPLLIALVFALAGCLGIGGDDAEPADGGDGNDGGDDGTDGDGSGGSGGSGGGGDDDDTNATFSEPPTANLTANLSRGEAPLNVTFTLDGSDPQGGEITWTLDLGDGNTTEGDELPTDVDHRFDQAGNYTVLLTVSNEENKTTAELEIAVDELASAPVLYLLGDGSDVVVTDDPDGRSFGMGRTQENSEQTTYITVGSWAMDSWNNRFVPTFSLDQDVSLTGEPVRLITYVDSFNLVNMDDDICPLAGHLFDGSGASIVADSVNAFVAPGLGEYLEITFEFEPEAGDYDGLGVQFGTTGIDCGTFPVEWVWGSDAYPGRVELAQGDQLSQ